MGVTVKDFWKSKYPGQYIENALDTFENMSEAYDPTKSYSVGDFVLYENNLYVCTTATTVGAFDPDYWEQTTLSEILDNAAQTYTDPNSDGNIVIG